MEERPISVLKAPLLSHTREITQNSTKSFSKYKKFSAKKLPSNLWKGPHPDSPKRSDVPTPCCYHWLLYSKPLATSIFNETLPVILKLRNLIIKFVASVSTWSHGTSSNLAWKKAKDNAAGPPRYHLYINVLLLFVSISV